MTPGQSLNRRMKDRFKHFFFLVYRLLTGLGIHLLPVHYYSAEPNIVELERSKEIWAKATSFPGIHVNLDEQIEALRVVCLPYQSEYTGNNLYQEAVHKKYGPGFGYIEAQVLYSMIRHYRPVRLLEVGSGISTFCSFMAAKKNQQEEKGICQITCVEPNPSKRLLMLAESTRHVRLIPQPVQMAPEEPFGRLSADDILFIDSSHVLKAGSDVHYLVLEILPKLKPGVLVHFHDIYFPYDYQQDLLETFLHSNETPFLRAFLAFNDRFSILFSLSHLHYERKKQLKTIFPDYEPQLDQWGLRKDPYDPEKHFPSSLWLRVKS